MRIIIVILCGVSVWLSSWAADTYERLEAKAERFVQLQEWNSAHAMYLLMIDKRPDEVKSYARAIVTGGLLGDNKTQTALQEDTQKRGMSLDSIFSEVRKFSFEIGESNQYEKFLMLVKGAQPWMSRHINMRLLKYYDFRNDAGNMVLTGNELLAVTPDDIYCLSAVARGYMLLGDYEKGVMTYERILALEPDNYDSLVALGNYFDVMWKMSEGTRSQMTATKMKAIEYLQKAYTLRPTPFIESKLAELQRD